MIHLTRLSHVPLFQAGLDASLGDSPQTQPPLPQSKRPVGHAPPPSRQGTHIGMFYDERRMSEESLKWITGSQPQKKQDLDSLINNLQTDTTTITARPTVLSLGFYLARLTDPFLPPRIL